MQALSGGNFLIGYGGLPAISEYAPDGTLLFDAHQPYDMSFYRAFRYPWSAVPAAPPAVAASQNNTGEETIVHASWNGATGVASWRVLAGKTAGCADAAGDDPRHRASRARRRCRRASPTSRCRRSTPTAACSAAPRRRRRSVSTPRPTRNAKADGMSRGRAGAARPRAAPSRRVSTCAVLLVVVVDVLDEEELLPPQPAIATARSEDCQER